MKRLSAAFTGGISRGGRPPEGRTIPKNNSGKTQEAMISKDMATLGVSLTYLQSLDVDQNATFHGVRDKILEMTSKCKGNRSLASYLMQDSKLRNMVSQADYFVSYAWNGGFGATISALVEHFKDKPAPFLWIDIAMIDQHVATETNVDFGKWSPLFIDILKIIGKCLLVIVPAKKPVALSRLWCLYEWICIRQAEVQYEFCSRPEDIDEIIHQMETARLGTPFFRTLLAGIDVEKASATKSTDEAAILMFIHVVGIKNANDITVLMVRDWLLSIAREGEKRVKPGSKESIYILNAKASLYSALGAVDEALPLFWEALRRSRLLPNNDAGVALQLNNLAGMLRAKKEYATAESLYREAISIWKKHLGNDHPDVASGLSSLADVLREKGDDIAAEPLHREAVSVCRRAFGNDHPNVAIALNNLAEFLCTKGDYAAAEPLFRQALAIDKRVLDEFHNDVARDLNNLAELFRIKGDFAAAEPLLREALEMDKKVLGEHHPDVARDLNNLGGLLFARGNFTEAEALLRESISIGEKTLGRRHRDMATRLNNLALLLRTKRDYVAAEMLYREALDIQKRVLGGAHPAVAIAMNNLAGLLRAKGDLPAAEKLCREAVEIWRKIQSNGSADMATALNNLGLVLLKQGKGLEAQRFGEEAIAIRERILGPNHPKTIKAKKVWDVPEI